ncbi:hypothetical protein [Pararcticibacter amylolyticus]|uniref:Uncharacterized protein n=1 Tax=Pararcticibacter amylolyticus TaxID=2173175 RepID=A0A2U2PCP9_9SPHI|nr:hypothetical protein [Pararcticibacter amylolyticus]PWG78899.1 hypothetical protein DDR33_19790 [Pararcticibacter amylolyticus]
MTSVKIKDEKEIDLPVLEEDEPAEDAFEFVPLDRAEKLFIWTSVIWGIIILGLIVFCLLRNC